MVRISFRLTMPGHGAAISSSWGKGKNYIVVRTLTNAQAAALMAGKDRRTWWHRWDDGWVAQVEAFVLAPRARLAKSDGFAGYEWMVDNIIRHGDTRVPPTAVD